MSPEERMWFKVQHCSHVIWIPILKFCYTITEWKLPVCIEKIILKLWKPNDHVLKFCLKISPMHSLIMSFYLWKLRKWFFICLKKSKFSMKAVNSEIEIYHECTYWMDFKNYWKLFKCFLKWWNEYFHVLYLSIIIVTTLWCPPKPSVLIYSPSERVHL